MNMMQKLNNTYAESGSITNEKAVEALSRTATDDASAIRFILNTKEIDEKPSMKPDNNKAKTAEKSTLNSGKHKKKETKIEEFIVMSDSGNADLLAEVLAGKAVYDTKLQAWRCFDGKIWREVDDAVVIHLAEVCLRNRAEKCDSDSDSVRYFVRSSCNYNEIRDAVKLLH